MHRNHVYIRAKISAIADKLKSLIDISSAAPSDNDGHTISGCVKVIAEELDLISYAATMPESVDESGKTRKVGHS